MAADLDAALEPGETVVYRTSGRSYRRLAIALGSAIPGFVILSGVKALFDPDYQEMSLATWVELNSALVLLFAGIIAAILFVQVWRQRRSPDQLVLTDRRLLFAEGSWTHKIDSVSLAKIKSVTRSADFLSYGQIIVDSDQVTLTLPKFHFEAQLAEILTNAANVKPLLAINRLADVDLRILAFSLAGSVGYLLPAAAISLSGLQGQIDEQHYMFTIKLSADLGFFLFGLLLMRKLTNLLNVSLMHQFATFEEMVAVLLSLGGKPWQYRPALHWAEYLYGRRLSSVWGQHGRSS